MYFYGYGPGVALDDVIGVVQIIYVKKIVANVVVDTIMSQNFQFMKVKIVYINPKVVATIL